MGDLTIVIMHECIDIDRDVMGSVGGYIQHGLFTQDATCTCKAFKFTKRGADGIRKPCKHIKEAEATTKQNCVWHQIYGTAQTEKGICPECGGPTRPVKVGV